MDERIPIDPQTVEWTPGPGLELPPEVLTLRAVIEAVGTQLLGVPDDALEALWAWTGSNAEVDVRYGFYRIYEELEFDRGQAMRAVVASSSGAAPGALRAVGSTGARWSLHGLLLPLTDEDLDRDPGGGEWTIRETLGHMLLSQRFYARFTAWWLTQAPTPGAVPPESLADDMPDRADEAAGSVGDIRARLDALLDLSMARFGGLDDTSVAVPARWSDGEVTVGFRLGRWASHLREHTIQVEKTLVMLGRPATEVERLVRLIYEAYGRLEEVVFGLELEQFRARQGGVSSAADVFRNAAIDLAQLPAEILAAARAAEKA
jgi:DinB superfamily